MQTNWTQEETNSISKADNLYMPSFYEDNFSRGEMHNGYHSIK